MDHLNRIHVIATSKTEIMMEWIYIIEHQTDFRDEAKEWREKITNNDFNYFILFFTNRDKRVQSLAKLRPKAAADADYSSVANVCDVDIEKRMRDKLNNGLAALALAMDKYLNQAVVAN